MSSIRPLALVRCAALALVLVLPACHTDQLQTARVITEGQGQLVVAMPENTPGYRKMADKIARDKLGKNYTLVEGKEVTTEDNVGKEVTRTGLLKPDKTTKEEVYRREYHLTYRTTGNAVN